VCLDGLGLVEEGGGFEVMFDAGCWGRGEQGEGVFSGEVGADCAALVEGEAGGEGDGGDFAEGVAGEVGGGLCGVVNVVQVGEFARGAHLLLSFL